VIGLGKTVESIALMLLNRHPLSSKRADSIFGTRAAPVGVRDITVIPTIDLSRGLELLDPQLYKWWQMERDQFKEAIIPDRITGGRVSQVAVSAASSRFVSALTRQATLIVTPPSLLKQWVAEMATHAPTLRVCVYAGWKSLLDGVAKRVVTDKASHKSRLVAKRKRDNDRQRASTVRKYQKTTRGKSIKIEPGDTPDSEDEELPVEDLQQRTQRLFVDFVRAHDVVITTYP
jgi:E3 ubiquitin-protein ligase SHPRH